MFYYYDKYLNEYHIWKEGWPNDTFERLTKAQFKELLDFSERFPALVSLSEKQGVED